MPRISIIIFTLCLLIFSQASFAAFTFTGDVDEDFVTGNCLNDGDTQDVGIPDTYAATGFDIEEVCFFYDGLTDDLYVGVSTINDIIFGDADASGDPGQPAVTDPANLGNGESFVISFDLDGDSEDSAFDASTVDVVAGVSSTGSYDDIGVYDLATSYDPLNPQLGFGSTLVADITLFGSPSVTIRDLEFTIHHFKDITIAGMGDIINKMYLHVFADAPVIGEEYVPNVSTAIAHPVFDYDEDTLEDWEELLANTSPTDDDSDDDGILDGIEINGDNPTDPSNADSDGDSCDDGVEDTNQNGSYEPFLGEADPNQIDSDKDEIDDCTELTGSNPTNPGAADTDGDGLLDGEEDFNHNGAFEPDSGETDPNKADTDGGGVNDKDELDYGFDPNDPTDDQLAAEQITVSSFNQVQGGGCSLATQQLQKTQLNRFSNPVGMMLLILCVCVFFILAVRLNTFDKS